MRDRGLLVVISGPAGSGKTTLAEKAVAACPEACRAVTATTRRPRGSEAEGADYYFLSREEFERGAAAGRFAEYAEFNGNLYGTPVAELEKHFAEGRAVLLVIDVQGAAQLRRTMPHALHAFVLPPTPEELRRRLGGRGTESREEVEKRLRIAEREIGEIEKYDYLVVNDDVEQATSDLLDIIRLGLRRKVRGGERERWLAGGYAIREKRE